MPAGEAPQPQDADPPANPAPLLIDRTLLDRHRDGASPRIGWWLDLQDPQTPAWLPGPGLCSLVDRPFGTRPTLNTASWAHGAEPARELTSSSCLASACPFTAICAEDWMREVLGWPCTQHETSYMMAGGPDCQRSSKFQVRGQLPTPYGQQPQRKRSAVARLRVAFIVTVRSTEITVMPGGKLTRSARPLAA